MSLDLHYAIISHPQLGALTLEELLGEGGIAYVARARDADGRAYAVKFGRRAGKRGAGYAAAFERDDDGGPRARRLELNAAMIDSALIAEGRRLEIDGEGFHLAFHGLGQWHDLALDRPRPALILDEIEGRSLSSFSREDWLEESWQIIADLLVMLMISPRGESSPHGDIKTTNVFVGGGNKVQLIDPGVSFARSAGGEARLTLTTFEAYPAVCPGTPCADLLAIGLMVYEGLTGQRALGVRGCPAPEAYNFGCGAFGRDAPSPESIINEIVPPRDLTSDITPQMEELVMSLLRAPLNPEIALGQGPTLRQWVAACHFAAESVR